LHEYVSEKVAEEYDVEKGISFRQLLDDIRIMRKDPAEGYGAPIIRKDGEVFYEDPDFSINNNPLNDVDIDSLNNALNLLKPFRSLPFAEEINTIIGKIKGTISQNEGENIIELEHNPQVKGLEHIDAIYKIIKEENVISLKYRPFISGEILELEVHPYLIKEYNNRWFLLGWDSNKSRYSVFGFDRIENFKVVDKKINLKKKAGLLKLQKDIIGVSMDQEGEPQEIRIWSNPTQLKYLLTKPIHSSQKLIEENNDGGILSLKLCPNYEFEQKILSFGENVKVLEPIEFQEKIKRKIQFSLNKYIE